MQKRGKMKKVDYKQALENRKIKKPNAFTQWMFNIWCSIVCRRNHVQYTYQFDKKQIKKQQVILLSTHSARNEFFYTLYGFRRKDMHIICGLQNFFKNKTNYKALNSMGVIPKSLFQPDLKSIRKIMTVLKKGRSIALFPEGIQSLSGSTHPINPATTKFLTRAGVTVVLATTQGAYLTGSRYSKDEKHGKVFVNYQVLFTAEEIKTLTEEQIYSRMLEKFRYNDFEANKVNRIKYVGKKPNSDGLDNILYICPICNQKHVLSVEGDAIVCKNCGYTVHVNEYYDLVEQNNNLPHDTIDKWFKWQRRTVHDQVREENYSLCANGKLMALCTDSWKNAPNNHNVVFEGKVVLNKEGLTLSNDQGESKNFQIDNLYSLTMVTGKHLEFYYKDDYYRLWLDIPKTQLIEWMLASEELHNAQDEKWYTASNDVYDYNNKGEA